MLSFVNFSRSALRDDPQISTSETQAQPRLVTSGRAGRVWKSIEKRHYYPHSFFQVSGFACRLWLISFRDNEQCLFKEDGDSQRNDMSTSVIVPSQLSRPSTGSITRHTILFTSIQAWPDHLSALISSQTQRHLSKNRRENIQRRIDFEHEARNHDSFARKV